MAQPEQGTGAIAPDETFGDGDSAIDEEINSTTSSIASSIFKFRKEHGRTYNAYGERTYYMPNDEIEKDRYDLAHHLWGLTLSGRLLICPAASGKLHRVLDVGTGTGIWAMDFAEEHPEAEVIGVDVSPIQPNFVPPNVQFVIDDIERPWAYSKPFDLIFSRQMLGAIPEMKSYVQKCYDNLKPGSWLEMQEPKLPAHCDDDTYAGTQFEKWQNLALEASQKLGCPMDIASTCKATMEAVGFEDVTEVIYKWPINKWPADKKMKEIGLWSYENVTCNLTGINLVLFIHGLGWKQEELEAFLVDVRRDLKNPKIHAYWPVYVVYGRKPATKIPADTTAEVTPAPIAEAG
ncbi:S-adenosyl-L-methionine-dependent methyltransferase [Hyaloscypha sp. PMI_1271]|nr:S-adenosyl-L-methionine-dependent methyltransferase [Hyaloscypha sp. PMI_1271]